MKLINSDPEVFSQIMEEIQQQIITGNSDEAIIQRLVSGKNFPEEMAVKLVIDLRNKLDAENAGHTNEDVNQASNITSEQKPSEVPDNKLSETEKEIKDKVLVWRNNAFSNDEIIQKLVQKYNLTEDKARQIVKTIHLHKSVEERQEAIEAEEESEHSSNIYIGAFLLVGGIISSIALFMIDDDLGDYITYTAGAAIGGFFQMVAGLSKQKYKD